MVRPRQEKLPAVLVNVGCYYTLADTLEKVEGPRYAAQGYGYVLWRALGPVEEVADRVFQRWRSDAAAVLDWLGQQSWCLPADTCKPLTWDVKGPSIHSTPFFGSKIKQNMAFFRHVRSNFKVNLRGCLEVTSPLR